MTIDFIPLYLYTSIYWFVLLLTATFTMIRFSATEQDTISSVSFGTGYLLAVFTLIYMGLRPTSGVFVDMTNYASVFDLAQEGADSSLSSDIGFDIFLKLSGSLVSQRTFFFLCSLLYIAPIVLACRRWSPTYWPFLLVAFLGSFSFWAYGVNGIRNGIATSFLLFAFSLATLWPRLICTALSVSFHKSVALPAIGYYMASTQIDIRWFFRFWLLAIPLSLIFGGFWESFLSKIVSTDERASSYFDSVGGFRWDFLLYSFSGVAAGYFYTYVAKFDELNYKKILGSYLFSNAIWILVIRASFSNRFAYLSWFAMAFVIFYPLVKVRVFQKHYFNSGLILFLYCLFSFFMYVLLK